MEDQIQHVAALSYIDQRLDELQEEFGDLPLQVKKAEKKVNEAKAIKEDTERILEEIRNFYSTSKQTLVQLKDKEDKLSKQQFQVRNNKEFDAITKELEHIKKEHQDLSDRLRTEGLKEENLVRILESQKKDFDVAQKELDDIKVEYEDVFGSQNDEVNELMEKRNSISQKIKKEIITDYERIRSFYSDAAVQVRRNSCSGCFSAIPPQIIVEIRTNHDRVYTCENCGRLLVPEEISIDDNLVENLNK